MKRALATLALMASVAGCSDEPETSAGPPDGGLTLAFEQVPYETELSYITDLAFLPDDSGEAIVCDLYGGLELVQVRDDGAEVLLSTVVEDVFAEYDAGQLAVAIDPDFASNSYFYVAANLSKSNVVVRRYTLDRADAEATLDSAVVILDLSIFGAPRWHNISAIGFDAEGLMWLLVGDKGTSQPDREPASAVAQDASSQLGSLMTIAPSKDPATGGYTVPGSVEPYAPDGDPAVLAKGIRSPWKGVHHEGRWFYGDVGLDDFEEINIIEGSGENFGWPLVEGPCELDVYGNGPDCGTLADPWIHYGRSNSLEYVLDDLDAEPTNKRSVYAGWIYQPTPDDPYEGRWDEVLVWGDAFVGFMRASPLDGDGEGWHLGHLPFPSAWAQGPDGFVYVAALSEHPSDEDPTDVSGLPSPLLRAVLGD